MAAIIDVFTSAGVAKHNHFPFGPRGSTMALVVGHISSSEVREFRIGPSNGRRPGRHMTEKRLAPRDRYRRTVRIPLASYLPGSGFGKSSISHPAVAR